MQGQNDLDLQLVVTLISIALSIIIPFSIYMLCHWHNKKKLYRVVKTYDGKFRIQKYTDHNWLTGNVNGYANCCGFYAWQWLYKCEMFKECELYYDSYEEAESVVKKLRKGNNLIPHKRKEPECDKIIKVYRG